MLQTPSRPPEDPAAVFNEFGEVLLSEDAFRQIAPGRFYFCRVNVRVGRGGELP